MVYSQGFGVSDRRLAFQGEGYFEVEKNDEMPFLVQTHDVNVTVVGTKFNFRNYPEDEEAVVELLEGKGPIKSIPQTSKISTLKMGVCGICCLGPILPVL